jgi:endonuclease I
MWVGAVEVDQLIGAATGSEPARAQSPRATLYFLLRYPGLVDPDEVPAGRLEVLLNWVRTVPRRRLRAAPQRHYERHRNAAIFAAKPTATPLSTTPE